jgi:hypothetical protein
VCLSVVRVFETEGGVGESAGPPGTRKWLADTIKKVGNIKIAINNRGEVVTIDAAMGSNPGPLNETASEERAKAAKRRC